MMESRLWTQLNDYFSKRNDIIAAYLFGSQARGRIGKLSDIDVAVLLDGDWNKQGMFKTRLEILGELSDLLRREDIDVVILNEAPPLLAHRILKEGKLLHSRTEKKRLDYEVRAILRYLDWKPFLEKYTKEALRTS